MNKYDVEEIIRKEREINGMGLSGVICILLWIAILVVGYNIFKDDYKALKDRVEQLESRESK